MRATSESLPSCLANTMQFICSATSGAVGLSLDREHFLKRRQDCEQRCLPYRAESPRQPPPIENSDLFQQDEALLAGKPRRNTVRSGPAPRRQRCGDHQRKMIVNIRGRNDEAWPRFANFAALRRIEPRQPYLTALY